MRKLCGEGCPGLSRSLCLVTADHGIKSTGMGSVKKQDPAEKYAQGYCALNNSNNFLLTMAPKAPSGQYARANFCREGCSRGHAILGLTASLLPLPPLFPRLLFSPLQTTNFRTTPPSPTVRWHQPRNDTFASTATAILPAAQDFSPTERRARSFLAIGQHGTNHQETIPPRTLRQ